MDELPGKRRGTSKFIYGGYGYHRDPTSVGNNVYRCSARSASRCIGSVRVDGNEVHVMRPHNHPANPHLLQEALIKVELLRLCRETSRTFDDIYREVALRYISLYILINYQRKIQWLVKTI